MTLPANKTDFTCCDCGVHIIRCVPSPTYPRCELCVWLPGWWRDPAMRKRLAHDEPRRTELALRAAAEAAGSPFCKFNKNYANPIFGTKHQLPRSGIPIRFGVEGRAANPPLRLSERQNHRTWMISLARRFFSLIESAIHIIVFFRRPLDRARCNRLLHLIHGPRRRL